MQQTVFGHMPDGTPVYEVVLKNENYEVSLITYGGSIRRYVAFGTDIVCGFDTLESYLADTSHQGALVGRYANRIAAGHFNLDGKSYQLDCNSGGGKVHLHGGFKGYSRKVWEILSADENHLTLRMDSPDGEQGYPGHVVADVTYALTERGLSILYRAVTDAATPLNMTNHAYFNLSGCGAGSILGTTVVIHADEYSPLDETMIPTGHAPVTGTVFDFTVPHTVGERIGNGFGGYDHNYILRQTSVEKIDGHSVVCAARADNGHLALTVYTNQPCLQFYIGNSLDGPLPFKGGTKQEPHTTFCFEAQTEPDGPNRGEGILHPEEVYEQYTVYAVSRV